MLILSLSQSSHLPQTQAVAGLGVSSKAFLGWTCLHWLKVFVEHSFTSKVLHAWALILN